ncbi:MAG: hypothetical protein GTN75_12830 [Gemmatimonadetes bacterium]|nr:hypothetical protein [Gemmatimonadota bacterium]
MSAKRILTAMLATVVASGIACSDEATGPTAELGQLDVHLNMMGDRPDPNGCTVAVDGGEVLWVGAGETVTFTDLALGAHTVTIADLEAFCTLDGEDTRSVTISSDGVVTVQFDVTCGNSVPDYDVAGMEILGSGYNVTGNYADVADVKAVVLDLPALQASKLLRQVQYERATYHVVSGEDSHEYQRNLSARVSITGSAFGFSGALKASFKKDRYESRHFSFATVQSVIRKHGLRVALSVKPEEMRGFLTPAAASAINDPSVDPGYIFETFGTHVLTGIIVGGRLDFSTSANMSFERENRSIDVYARASFKNIFASASIEAEATDNLAWSEYSASEEKHLEVYGGRSEYGQYIMNEGIYESWIESIEEHSVFMDFESTGLLGIWQLADDAGRRADLEGAWNTYAEVHGITLGAAGTIVSDFAEDPEGWRYYDYSNTLKDPQHHVQGGHFGGYIVGSEESSTDGRLDFSAPSEFLGDKTMYAGGKLQYYLWYEPYIISVPTGVGWHNSIHYYIVLLSENGNLRYKWESDAIADPRFRPGDHSSIEGDSKQGPTLFVINLQAGEQGVSDGSVHGQWYRWDNTPASETDIWRSLASVRAILLRAEFLFGLAESVALDKVRLTAPSDNP